MNTSKKKVLYLVTQSEWGGAQEYVFNLATSLPRANFEPIVAAGAGNDELFLNLQQQGIKTIKLRHTIRPINPFQDLNAIFELIKLYRQEKPNVIHLNSSKIGFTGSLALKLLKIRNSKLEIRAVYTAHGWVFNEPLPWLTKKLYFWIEKISASWKDIIICVSENDRQLALKNNFQSKLITIHNAVDPDKLYFLDRGFARDELEKLIRNSKLEIKNSFLIATIANFYPTKGLDILIKTAALVVKEMPDVKFVIFGDGPEKTHVEKIIAELNLSNNVILTGQVPDAHKYLKAFDLYLSTSVKEGLPYAILKAQAAGLPIVATRVGGLPEILSNNNLVPTPNCASLRDKIFDALAGRLMPMPQQTNQFSNFINYTINLY